MASPKLPLRPSSCLKLLSCTSQQPIPNLRPLSTVSITPRYQTPPPPRLPLSPIRSAGLKKLKTYPPPPSTRAACPTPLPAFTTSQLALLDPTGARMRLFQYSNPDHARTGDVLLVRFKTGEPFAGVCLSIRKRGVDTGILLRNHVMRTGTELWVKVFSPKVGGVEVVQRAEKKVRRARLFYMRQPKHDRGSVDNVVQAYLGKRSGLRSGAVGLMDRKMKKDRKLRN